MNTVVIKYPNTKSTLQKEESFFLIKGFKQLAYILFRILTFWIPKANANYEAKLDDIEYWYIEVEKETGIPLREIGFDKINSAILLAPTDRNYGFWTDSNMEFDTSQFPNIENEIFNDIFEAMETYHIDCIRQKINKYFLKWTDNQNLETPQFPILVFDLTNENELFYFDSWEFLSKSEVTMYEWEPNKRLIDSKGNIYRTTYINFGHPVGCVYPEKLEQTISLESFKSLLKSSFKYEKDLDFKGQTFEELFKELV